MKNLNIGNTPLVELKELEKSLSLKGRIFAKLESFNPAGSVKDRIAYQMIKDAEDEGKLIEGSTIIEPTSGNTGIGIAYIGKQKGYRVLIVMPESMSIERRQIIQSYGAELVLTEASKGMKGAIEKAEELQKTIKNSLILGQFTNPSNPKAHYLTTGPEIYKELKGQVDIFISAVGTGGTITGAGRYLKEQNSNIKVVAVEPASSPVLSGGKPGPHKIQGIGAGFIPDILDTSLIDLIIPVTNEDAFMNANKVFELDKVSAGISSGAALTAAIELAKEEEKNIVVIFPDNRDKYRSTDLFK